MRKFLIALAAALLSVGVVSCDDSNEVGEAVEEAGDEVEEAADEVEDEI